MLRYLPLPPDLDISENGETIRNGWILEIAPKSEGASPWS
jgi:hypothetical protein